MSMWGLKRVRKNESCALSVRKRQRENSYYARGKISFFGEKLILKPGDVNNLYSDILMLYNMVSSADKPFSPNVYALFRMALRLLCETAMRDLGFSDIKAYIEKYAPAAKKKFSRDIATLLSSQNVKKKLFLSCCILVRITILRLPRTIKLCVYQYSLVRC